MQVKQLCLYVCIVERKVQKHIQKHIKQSQKQTVVSVTRLQTSGSFSKRNPFCPHPLGLTLSSSPSSSSSSHLQLVVSLRYRKLCGGCGSLAVYAILFICSVRSLPSETHKTLFLVQTKKPISPKK